MNRLFKVLTIACLFSLAAAPANAGDEMPPPDNSSPELKRIKSLEGRWETITSMFGKKNQRMYTEYEVTAGGSAVLERIFPGTPYEMISVYYDDDNGKLAMTHYCIMRNRPSLKLAGSTDDTITLRVDKVSGPKGKKGQSMGDIELKFIGKNRFVASCGSKGKGKHDENVSAMEYRRVR